MLYKFFYGHSKTLRYQLLLKLQNSESAENFRLLPVFVRQYIAILVRFPVSPRTSPHIKRLSLLASRSLGFYFECNLSEVCD